MHRYQELLNFLEDILPNKDERDYTLTYLSIGLVGNLLELFTILTGCGRNGKSKLIELLKEKRQAVISYAVTKGLDPNVKMKDSGVEWLGEVPDHWEIKKIKTVFSN